MRMLASASLLMVIALAAPRSAAAETVRGPQSATEAPCRWSTEETAWLGPALSAWESATERLLGRPAEGLPWMVLFDQDCVWNVAEHAAAGGAEIADIGLRFRGAGIPVTVHRHLGTFVTPNDSKQLPTPTAATLMATDGRPFFVLALMRIWKERPDVAHDPDPTLWLTRVALHEMVHTLHLHHIAQNVERLHDRGPLPAQVGDDIVEDRFASNPTYRDAFLQERDLLYRAALADTDAEARRLGREALALADARRVKYFTGADAMFAELEDVFLTMEGVAEWFAFRAVPRPAGATRTALSAAHANLKNSWSQAEGLAMFLLIERLATSNWPSRVLGPIPPSPFAVLREATRDP